MPRILLTHFTTTSMTCFRFNVFPHKASWWIIQWYFRTGRQRNFSDNAKHPDCLPVKASAPSEQILSSFDQSILLRSAHNFRVSNKSLPFVVSWIDSNPKSSSINSKSSLTDRMNTANWAVSEMFVDASTASEKCLQFWICWATWWWTMEWNATEPKRVCFRVVINHISFS